MNYDPYNNEPREPINEHNEKTESEAINEATNGVINESINEVIENTTSEAKDAAEKVETVNEDINEDVNKIVNEFASEDINETAHKAVNEFESAAENTTTASIEGEYSYSKANNNLPPADDYISSASKTTDNYTSSYADNYTNSYTGNNDTSSYYSGQGYYGQQSSSDQASYNNPTDSTSSGTDNYGGTNGSYTAGQGYYSNPANSNEYNSTYYTSKAAQQNSGRYYSGGYQQPYSSSGYTAPYSTYTTPPPAQAAAKKKKKNGRFGAGIIAASILISSVVGFGGGYAANVLSSNNEESGNGVTIQRVVNSVDPTGSETEDPLNLSTTEITNLTADSVVEITTETVQTGSFNTQYITSGAGSGVIISESGYILTNYHVIEGASNISVTLRNGKSYTAEVVGYDGIEVDVAVLKIDETNLTPAVFGDSEKLSVGDKVVAIGNPLGQLGGTVTDGIISALSRELTVDDVTMELLQTNAAINPGNSGGGLFNSSGELVGIVVAKSSGSEIEGLGFAIPINDILEIFDDLVEHGYVTGRVDTGLSYIDINSLQMAMMYNVSEIGVYVLNVEDGSQAASSGFRSGDRIVSVDKTDVTTAADIDKVISEKSVGDTVEFVVDRSGQTVTLKLVLEEYTPKSNSNNNQNNNNGNENNDNFNGNYGGGMQDYHQWQ